MHVEVWDAEFVRARRADIHPLVRDPGTWPRWWPGVRAVPGGLVLSPPTVLAGIAHRRQRLAVRVVKDRQDLGVDLAYSGTLVGPAEFFYLDGDDGVVVSYVAHVDLADRGWRRTLAEHRAVVRAGLHELKDRLEGSRLPGAEPEPALLADQREAKVAFQRGVEAWAAKQTALREAEAARPASSP